MVFLVWNIKDIAILIMKRQLNKYDANLVVSGARGNGKSTLIAKLFYRFPHYKPKKHQVYSREDVMKLLESQRFGLVFDDEAINSTYKRDFYAEGQKKLIKMVNMYRDNFNVYASAIPSFYSMDKDLRALVKIHINVISRGLAVVHIANDDSLYSNDPWDIDYNKKVEASFLKKSLKNPNAKMPHQRLTTFRGFLRFGDLPKNQRRLYEDIKKRKRKEIYDRELKMEDKSDKKDMASFIIEQIDNENIYDSQQIRMLCIREGCKYSTTMGSMNRKWRDMGRKGNVITTLKELNDKLNSKNMTILNKSRRKPTI